MRNLLKWVLIIGGGLILLICLALVLIPFFVDMNKYKEPIENKISASIGRTFFIKGDVGLSLFPWAGISFSDLYLGNPEGFKEKDFLQIKAFEARVKLLPLLFRDIQVKRFVLDGASLSYVTLKSGRTNIDGLFPSGTSEAEEKTNPATAEETGGFPIKSIDVGEFSISNSAVLLVDERQNTRKEITGITLNLKDVSFTRPIKLDFAATIDKMPFAVEGQLGPLGTPLGEKDISVDLTLTVLSQLKTQIKGKLSQINKTPAFDLAVSTQPFSLKKVLAALGRKDMPVSSDGKVLEKLDFRVNIKGDAKAVSLTDGQFTIDDSKLTFSGAARDFDKPDLSLTAHLDNMNLDRYLPPKAPAGAKDTQSEATGTQTSSSEKADYGALRAIGLKVKLTAEALTASNINIKNLVVDITGNKGVFQFKPMAFAMYNGTVKATARANFTTNTPEIAFTLNASDINSNPLIKALTEKDIMEGTLKADLDLKTSGLDAVHMKRSLNGQGKLLFTNGAVKGIDLTAMARNIQTAFKGGSGAQASRDRTDFAEFTCPFTMENGVFNTSDTKLASPAIRVTATGKADLNRETLDFRIEPNFVATIAGQGDTAERSGFKVPVRVSGTFSSPKFAPDMGTVLQDTIKDKIQEKIGLPGLFKGEPATDGETETPKTGGTVEDAAKDLLKGLPFGR